MNVPTQTLQEARELLKELPLLPETGAFLEGAHVKIWFTFERLGPSDAGHVRVTTVPAVEDLHLLLTQARPLAEGDNLREAITDESGEAKLTYVLGNVPCTVGVVDAAPPSRMENVVSYRVLDQRTVMGERAHLPDETDRGSADDAHSEGLVLAAKSKDDADDGPSVEPQHWTSSDGALSFSVEHNECGESSLCLTTDEPALNGATVSLRFGGEPLELLLEPDEDRPGFFSGAVWLDLSTKEVARAQLQDIEVRPRDAPNPER